MYDHSMSKQSISRIMGSRYVLRFIFNNIILIFKSNLRTIIHTGMIMWEDLRGGRCSMGDACTNPSTEEEVAEMLLKNFNRHYKTNRAPFGLFYHSAWFNTAHHR